MHAVGRCFAHTKHAQPLLLRHVHGVAALSSRAHYCCRLHTTTTTTTPHLQLRRSYYCCIPAAAAVLRRQKASYFTHVAALPGQKRVLSGRLGKISDAEGLMETEGSMGKKFDPFFVSSLPRESTRCTSLVVCSVMHMYTHETIGDKIDDKFGARKRELQPVGAQIENSSYGTCATLPCCGATEGRPGA